jgi:hypothetical protein
VKRRYGVKSGDQPGFLIRNQTSRTNTEPSTECSWVAIMEWPLKNVRLDSKRTLLTYPMHSGNWLGETQNIMTLPFIWNTPRCFPSTSGCLARNIKQEVSVNHAVKIALIQSQKMQTTVEDRCQITDTLLKDNSAGSLQAILKACSHEADSSASNCTYSGLTSI